MTKLIFVLIDGLSAACIQHMAYLAAHAERGAVCGVMDCALPTLSRPIYATIFTGLNPLDTGITHNNALYLHKDIRKRSFFTYLHTHGYTCAAAAFYWVYELYHGRPFDPLQHRWLCAQDTPLPFGMFYTHTAYPDDHVFYDAALLQKHHTPDFLLVHTMGVDHAGHQDGFDSALYRNAVRHVDMLLAEHMPQWCASGSTVIITGDHGMHEDAMHNDLVPHVRSVPFWIIAPHNSAHIPTYQKDWYNILCSYFSA